MMEISSLFHTVDHNVLSDSSYNVLGQTPSHNVTTKSFDHNAPNHNLDHNVPGNTPNDEVTDCFRDIYHKVVEIVISFIIFVKYCRVILVINAPG